MKKTTSISEKTTTFGLHFMMDAYGANPTKLNDMKLVFRYLNTLPDLIGMRKLTSPLVVDCDATKSGKDPGGISGTLIISESHVSIHTFADKGFYTMDLYSCRDFEDKVVSIAAYSKKMFEHTEEEFQVIMRGLRYPV